VIDLYAGEVQFGHHLLPVYQALDKRGVYITDNSQANDPQRPVVVASYGDVKRVRRLGYTRIARMEHGAGQSYGTKHGSYAGGEDHDDVSLFLTPNQYSADKWQARYPKARVEVVGCPKLDDLPRKDPAEPITVAISFHWDCYLVPETVSAFQHYRFVLPQLNAAFRVIGHGHPRAQSILARRYRRVGIEFVPDFAEVCRRADLYICDNSSSLYEFAATGRPVVVLNQPMYRKDVHHGLRFWDAIPGPQVDDPKDLINTVAHALQDGPQQQQAREQALDMVYAYRSGAAQRAASILEEWAA
jgi:hypothetical protein